VFLLDELGSVGISKTSRTPGIALALGVVEAEEIAAKIGALGHDGVNHAGETNIESEPGGCLHLVGNIEARD
jgi:hypothetical protein